MLQNFTAANKKPEIYPGLKIENSLITTLLNTCSTDILIKKGKLSVPHILNYRISNNNCINTELPYESVKKIKLSGDEYVIECNFKKLCELIAFEVGHVSYSPDDYSIKGIDRMLGDKGLLYPADIDILYKNIPIEFYDELKECFVDIEEETIYYVPIEKVYRDYFLNSVILPSNKKYMEYSKIISQQNRELAKVMLYYLLIIANLRGVEVKILYIDETKIDILVKYNEFIDDKFYRALCDSYIVTLCGRKFEYFPDIKRILVSKKLEGKGEWRIREI